MNSLNTQWRKLGSQIFGLNHILSVKSFKSKFHLDPELVELVYKRLILSGFSTSPMRLLVTLYYLNSRNNKEEDIALNLRRHLQTLKKYVSEVLQSLNKALPKVIDYLRIEC